MKLKLILLFFILTGTAFAQSFSAKIIDKSTKEPVPFAAIQTGIHKGVISNEEGVFNFDLEQNTISEITISSLGYKTEGYSIEHIRNNNYLIELEPSVNELNTVYLNSTKPNADSIIARTLRNFKENHQSSDIKNHKLFHRETTSMDFKKLNFEINKASHVRKKQLASVNNELDAMSNDIMSSNFVHFNDFMGRLSVSSKLGYKLEVDKATQIINAKKDFSLDNIQDNAQNIVLKYLDTTLTYKLKSGLFKIQDSLSLVNKDKEEDKLQEYEIDDLKSKAYNMYADAGENSKSLLKGIINLDYYRYTLRDVTFDNENMIYIIDFRPRRAKSKYTGTLYIADDNYGVLKASYKYAKGKRGEKLNLRLVLGVKYIENVKNGIMLFKKNTDNTYDPRYIKEETSRYFYIHRPIKFIENSRAKRKVAFDFKIEGDAKHKRELLFTESKSLTLDEFTSIKELKVIPYTVKRKYDASVWGTNETLAPTEELKTFDASKN